MQARLLDCGLARAYEGEAEATAASGALSHSPASGARRRALPARADPFTTTLGLILAVVVLLALSVEWWGTCQMQH